MSNSKSTLNKSVSGSSVNKNNHPASIVPDLEMRSLALSSLEYANGYFSTLEKSMSNPNSRFDNELLYQFAVMSLEKYFIALLARYDWNATHHMPIAMYKEALVFEPDLTDKMKQTSILVGKFEAICALDGFGYRTPTNQELSVMCVGIKEIKKLVVKRVSEI
jgi:lambda repressor-like predicted transcriptional regulator